MKSDAISIASRGRRPRTNTKQRQIVDVVRGEIMRGVWKSGALLPVQTKLATRFQVSCLTVHHALRQLAREGFVEARRRVGTRVVERLPHLTNLALIFPTDPTAGRYYSKFYSTLGNIGSDLQREQARQIAQFHGVDWHADTVDRQRLVASLQAHQLAGLIFAASPHMLVGSPVLELPGVPRVAIMLAQEYPQVPAVNPEYRTFITKALDNLLARGRKRVAVIDVPGREAGRFNEIFQAELAARGMTCPPYWRQFISQEHGVAANHLVQLLMRVPAPDRPDGLIVTDDNLVDHALAGLIAAGVRVPDQVAVVVHCNFPAAPLTYLPVQRLGYDCRTVLQTCVGLIDQQRRGESVTGLTSVPAVFEDELRAT